MPLSEHERLWNSAGMHRPIASFWYNYIFLLISAVPALLIVGYLIPNVLMPFPSSLGIANVVGSYFQLMYVLFDLGTGMALQRFVAEHAVKRPGRALQYLQFFSWFQLFTGLIQTTSIAIWILFIIRSGDNAFLAWPFLINSLTQYPGMLGVYKNALGAFQRHDKQIIIDLFQNMLVQSITQVVFILLGRWWGSQDPQIGELLGASMGYIIGSYLDDFVGMMLGAYFFHQIIYPLGYTVMDSIKPTFTKEIIKDVIIYGLKVMPAYGVNALVNFLVLLMTMAWLPNYTTIIAIVNIASGFAYMVATSFTITPAISEAYNNGYENLTQYYIKQQWKHWTVIASFLFVEIYMLIPPMFRELSGNYALAAEILGYLLIVKLFVFPINFGSSIAQAINHPEYQTYALFFEQATRAFMYYSFLNPTWGLITVIGAQYYLLLYVFADMPAYLMKLITQWAFLKKTLKFSISPSWYQTFIAPLLTMIPLIALNKGLISIFYKYIGNAMKNPIQLVGLITFVLVMILFIFPIFVLFPVYGFVGGWDDDGLKAFENAAKISGPSKFLVRLMAKFTAWTHKISPLANRFPIDYNKARAEAEILTRQRLKFYENEKEIKS